MKGLKSFSLALMFLLPWTVSAQDPAFSQFFASPLNISPAFAGIAYGPRVIFNYRNQWPSLRDAFVTYAVSYDQHIEMLDGGIGVSLLSDVAGNGLYQRTEASAIYSYQIHINKKAVIKTGLQASYVQTRLDWDRVLLPDMINILDIKKPFTSSEPPPAEPTLTRFDFAAGALVYTATLFGGLSVRHPLQPRQTHYDDIQNVVPIAFSGHLGGTINLGKLRSDKIFLAPHLMANYQKGFAMVSGGWYLNHKALFGGISYRVAGSNPDALTLLAGVSRSIFKMGYSYDITISPLGTASGGAHEVSLVMNFAKEGADILKSKGRVPIPSPVFL